VAPFDDVMKEVCVAIGDELLLPENRQSPDRIEECDLFQQTLMLYIITSIVLVLLTITDQ